MDFVEFPAGETVLRDARAGVERRVRLEPFALAVAPVTAGEFASHRELGGGGADASLPAHGVTWFDAVDWCTAASLADGLAPAYERDDREVTWDPSADGYRLPSEAEWQFACLRGGHGDRPLGEVAWTAADGVDGPQPVGGKAADANGLVDLLGNVWEWCWDRADAARYGEYRSLRGGGWADRPWSVRAGVRRGSAPDAVLEDVGFRVARGAVAPPGAEGAQGWSERADRERAEAARRRPLPIGWTPLEPR